MAFRKVLQETPTDDLYEQATRPVYQERETGKFAMPSLKLGLWLALELILGIIFLIVGISAAGSFYGGSASQFKGILATVFYNYQLSQVLIVSGTVLVYDTIRSLRR